MRGIEWLPLDKPSIQNGNSYSAERQNIQPFAHWCRETQQSCGNSVNSECSEHKTVQISGRSQERREEEEEGRREEGGSQQHLDTLTHCKE